MNVNRRKIINVAHDILNGKVSPIIGSRKLSNLVEYSPDSLIFNDFVVFIDVESETDSFPLDENERICWSEEALKLKDRELKEIETKYEVPIEKACRNLLKKLE